MQEVLSFWAGAKGELEAKVGRLLKSNRKGEKLDDMAGAKEVAEALIESDPRLRTAGDKKEAWSAVLKEVGRLQVEQSHEAKFYHKKWVRVALTIAAAGGASAALLLTGGLAALGLPTAAAAVLKGLGVGLGSGALGARLGRNARNTQEATQVRIQEQMSGIDLKPRASESFAAHASATARVLSSKAEEVRQGNEKMRVKSIVIGGLGGAAVGAAVAEIVHIVHGFSASGGAEGAVDGGQAPDAGTQPPQVPLSPAEINHIQHDAILSMLQTDPSQVSNIPGFEGFDPTGAADEAAAKFADEGRYLWSQLQNAGNLSNADTLHAIIGDGANSGGVEQLQAAGFDVDMGGDATMTSHGVEVQGDTWWIESMQTPDGGVYVTGPGDQIMFFDGQLDQVHQAAILDQLRLGGEILSPDQMADKLAAQLPDTMESLHALQAEVVIDQVVNEVAKEVGKDVAGLNPSMADSLLAEQKSVVQHALQTHASQLAQLPANLRTELIAGLDAHTAIPPDVINSILDEILKEAKVKT